MKPIPFPCHDCGHVFAGAICPLCKTDRPAFTMLKRMTSMAPPAVARTEPYPACKYSTSALCGCEGRGLCLEVA